MKKYRGTYLKNKREVGLLKEANSIVAKILNQIEKLIKPGIKTMECENLASLLCEEYQVKPAFKGYYGFPYTLCCSVNEEIVHGFPSERILDSGDIVSFDMGVIYKGFYGDAAQTFAVGEIAPEVSRLLQVTKESLHEGIEGAYPGNDLYAISGKIQKYVEDNGYSVIKRFVGHGIGTSLHEKPEIPNFIPKRGSNLRLKPGMVLAIEPMVSAGSYEVEILADNWTAVSRDRSLTAHFEHTIAVLKDGPEILSV